MFKIHLSLNQSVSQVVADSEKK